MKKKERRKVNLNARRKEEKEHSREIETIFMAKAKNESYQSIRK